MVLFYPALKERLIQRGREEGREEGREQGRKEGRQELQKAWEEWNARRNEAEVQGVEFKEPPPSAAPSPNGQ